MSLEPLSQTTLVEPDVLAMESVGHVRACEGGR